MPEDAEFSALDAEARRELRGLSKPLAEIVGRHLVAAGMLIDEEPERALEHARYARSRAARVGIVREAAGLTAYHAGEWAEALAELRAARRMSGGNAQLAVMADCERALGRPERALELAAEAKDDVPPNTAVELKIVAAGARRDMGQLDAAVVALQGPDLDPRKRDPWSARLFYAYADNLEAAGRPDEAIRWFLNAAEADDDELTDAAERAVELGTTFEDNPPPSADELTDAPEQDATFEPEPPTDTAAAVGDAPPAVADAIGRSAESGADLESEPSAGADAADRGAASEGEPPAGADARAVEPGVDFEGEPSAGADAADRGAGFEGDPPPSGTGPPERAVKQEPPVDG